MMDAKEILLVVFDSVLLVCGKGFLQKPPMSTRGMTELSRGESLSLIEILTVKQDSFQYYYYDIQGVIAFSSGGCFCLLTLYDMLLMANHPLVEE